MSSISKKARVHNTRIVIMATIGAAIAALLSNEANRFAFTALHNLIGNSATDPYLLISYLSAVASFLSFIIITVIFAAFVCKEKSDWLKFMISGISGNALGSFAASIILSISTAFYINRKILADDTHIINSISIASLTIFSALFTAVIISSLIKLTEMKNDTFSPPYTESESAPAAVANETKTENAPAAISDETKVSPKSRGISLVLCFFLGWLGIHRFYTGKVATGILWLFTGGLFGIGILVDFVMLLFKVYTDSDGLLIE